MENDHVAIRDKMNNLTRLLGHDFCVEANTGETAIYVDGSYYNLKKAILRNPRPEPLQGQIIAALDEFHEEMAHYIQKYGPWPSELCNQ